MSEWISVKDRLPKKDQLCVTVFAAEKNLERPYLSFKEHFEVGFGLQKFGRRKAVYWFSLPETPKEQNND